MRDEHGRFCKAPPQATATRTPCRTKQRADIWTPVALLIGIIVLLYVASVCSANLARGVV